VNRWIVTVVIACALCIGAGCSSDKGSNPPANTEPTASFTVTPSDGLVETTFQVDASGSSDAQDTVSVLQVRWDWENDGIWDTDWSATKTASHQYSTAGAKTINLLVKDTGGQTDDTTRTVVVGAAPAVIETSPADQATGISPYPIVTVRFSAAMDPASIDTLAFYIEGLRARLITYDAAEHTATLYPAGLAESEAEQTVHVGPTVRSAGGQAMGQEVVFHFTTGPLDCEHLRDRFEPNDDIGSATPVEVDVLYPGLTSCGDAGRIDYYRFTLTQAQRINVITEAAYVDTNLVSWTLNLRREDGKTYSTTGTGMPSDGGSAGTHYTFLPGTYWVEIGKYYGDSHKVVYNLELAALAPVPDDQYEDNDFPDQATPIEPGLHENLRGAFVDVDYYSIHLTVGQTITATATEITSTNTTRRLLITNPVGNRYTGHTDMVNPAVESWTATETGTYLIYVAWWTDNVIYNLNVEVSD
jgi:hypothetical protein